MTEKESHEPTPEPEEQPDQYTGMRELYASKSPDERVEMLSHAVSRTQVEAMLSVERTELEEGTEGMEGTAGLEKLVVIGTKENKAAQERYEAQDAEGRAKLLLNAPDLEQVKAMLAVERPDLAVMHELEKENDKEKEDKKGPTPEQIERREFLDRLKREHPEQYQQIAETDTEEAWRTYERAAEQSREEALDEARRMITRAEKEGATFDSLERQKVIDRAVSGATVEKEHLQGQAPQSKRIKPALGQSLRMRFEHNVDYAGRWIRDKARLFARRILRRP